MFRFSNAAALFAVGWIAAVGPVASAQGIFLAETNLRDACFSNEMSMKLTGTISVVQNGQNVVIKREAEATHVYFERFLDIKEGAGERTARFYNRADAAIKDGSDVAKIVLKANHTLLVAHRLKDRLLVYHPTDVLTREEIDVTSHFDSMSVPGLLPRKEVNIGATWQVPREVVQALVDLDAVSKCDVTGKLESVVGNFANISFSGLVEGISDAASVKVMIKGSSAAFNLDLKRLVQVEWRMSDQRDQGPVSPALSTDVSISLKRVPMETPVQLGGIALVDVPNGAPDPKLTQVVYRNLKKGFEFQFGRDWHMVNQMPDGKLVLRLIDLRGEFIAQCTLTPWTKVKTPMTLPEFEKMMKASAGWQQKDGPPLEATDKAVKSANGYGILRITAEGKLGPVDALRRFYLIAAPGGEQILIDFTMVPSQAAKLDNRDERLVQSLLFVEAGRIEPVPGVPTGREK
jgi:hypothetical protein